MNKTKKLLPSDLKKFKESSTGSSAKHAVEFNESGRFHIESK